MYVIYTADPFEIIRTVSCSLSIIEYSNFDNLDSFPLTIDNQKPIILDFILFCIGCRPNSACNIYIGVLFLKLIIFIIYKVMKYRKILTKYNAYLKRSCISQA